MTEITTCTYSQFTRKENEWDRRQLEIKQYKFKTEKKD